MVGVHHAPPNSGGGSDDEKQLFTNELCECVWIVGGHGVESTVSKRRMQSTWLSLVLFPPGPLASSFRAVLLATHAAPEQVNACRTLAPVFQSPACPSWGIM